MGILGVGIGVLIAYFMLMGKPPMPPVSSLHKLVYLFAGCFILATITAVFPRGVTPIQAASVVIAGTSLVWLALPILPSSSLNALSGFAIVTIGGITVMLMTDRAEGIARGVPSIAAQAIPLASMAFGLGLSSAAAGTLTYAIMSLSLALALVGVGTGGLIFPNISRTSQFLSVGAGGYLTVLGIGAFLYGNLPPASLILLALCLAMPFVMPKQPPAATTAQAWKRGFVIGVYTLTPAIVAVTVTLALR